MDENGYMLVAVYDERNSPDQPNGEFAICLKGSKVEIPRGAKRIDLPVKGSRVLARVELGKDWDAAMALPASPTHRRWSR